MRTNSNNANYHQKRALSAPAAAVAVIAILVIAYGAYSFFPAQTEGNNSTKSTSTAAAGGQGVSCASTAAWQVKQSELAYGGDSLAGTVAMNGFQVGTQNIGWADLTSASSPATSSGTYAPGGGFLLQYTETSTVLTYPIYAPFTASGTIPSSGTVIDTMGGIPVLTLQCAPSSSNANANIWNLIATPIQAPTSGASATTNVKVTCINSNGNSLTTAATTFPTTSTLITCNLDILQAYRGAGYNVPIYGAQQNPVTNYANGQTTYSGSVNRQTIALVLWNSTSGQTQLDPTANGLSITPVNTNLLASGTKAWVVTGFTGCFPVSSAASSTSPQPCLSLPLDMYANSHSGHLGPEVMFMDMQDLTYVLQNLVTASASSFTSSGSVGGACAGYSAGATPTSGNDAGSPAPLIKQCFGIINS